MSDNTSSPELRPILYFFDGFPEENIKQHGIPAALQSAETALLLLALGRWPAITGLIWQSCEILLKEKYTNQGEKSPKAYILQERFLEQSDRVDSTLHSCATKLRKLRNTIMHEGYSPKFNQSCIDTFFNAGMPYLSALIDDLFDLDMYHVLEWKDSRKWFWSLYKDTRHVLNRKLAKGKPAESALFLLGEASHRIVKLRGLSDEFFIPYDQVENIIGEHFPEWDFDVRAFKIDNMIGELSTLDGLKDAYLLPEYFCPICQNNSVLAKIDWTESEGNYKFQALLRLGCFECEYVVDDADILDVVFLQKLSTAQISRLETEDECYCTTISM